MNTGPERQQADGAWDKLKGKVKEGVGDLTDNHSLEAEGHLDQMKGEAKIQTGKVRDAAHDALEHGDESQKASGMWDRAAGKVKEGLGDLTGNASLEAEGRAQNAAGKAQYRAGEARDDLADRV